MAISSSVAQFLDKQELHYLLTDPLSGPSWHDQRLMNHSAARATLLENDQEKLLAIYPADSLLDLNAVKPAAGP